MGKTESVGGGASTYIYGLIFVLYAGIAVVLFIYMMNKRYFMFSNHCSTSSGLLANLGVQRSSHNIPLLAIVRKNKSGKVKLYLTEEILQPIQNQPQFNSSNFQMIRRVLS